MEIPYDIHEHTHRFACWSASRASSVTGRRFPVSEGARWIVHAGLDEVRTPDELPSVENFDAKHRAWRASIIGASGINDMRDGQAAKLINVYLKSRLINPVWANHRRVAVLHPPIDSLLLQNLDEAHRSRDGMIWIHAKRIGWSRLDCNQYEALIETLRENFGKRPLWMAEFYWPGFR